MSDKKLSQSTDYTIKELSIVAGNEKIDVSGLFEEINLFDNILTPVRSGNIVIRDAINLSQVLRFDGTEYIIFIAEKSENILPFSGLYKIYKQTNRSTNNSNSETYILHFVADEFVFSNQQKINQCYDETYSEIVISILRDYLRVPVTELKGRFDESSGVAKFIMPNLAPLDAINLCSKRAIDRNNSPNFLFFQNNDGFNFCTIPTLAKQKEKFELNFNVKNTTENLVEEILGVRSYEVLRQFDYLKNVQSGVFAGTFIGFDLVSRQIVKRQKNYADIVTKQQLTDPNFVVDENKGNVLNYGAFDSRVVLFPVFSTQSSSNFIQETNKTSLSNLELTDEYIFERRAIFGAFLNKRIRLLMPGNFGLSSGYNVLLNFPTTGFKEDKTTDLDESQKGKYTIIATRHIIKYNIHETVIDVASVDGSQASAQITRSKKESVERVKALKDSTLVADANQSQAEVARLLRS
jgi:hypothetical protein